MPEIRTNARWIILVATAILAGCTPGTPVVPTATPAPLATELTFYHFEEGFPQSLLDKFTEETGIRVNYETFVSYEEAEVAIVEGKVVDVVFLATENIGDLMRAELLAEIDTRNVPNVRLISANFRDLSFDPGNRHNVPWSWGTTGVLVRTDLITEPIDSWADLWETDAGQTGLWADMRSVFGMAQRALGYSVNSSDEAEIEAAYQYVLERLDKVTMVETLDPYTAAYALADGTLVTSLGWAYDARVGAEENSDIQYIIPPEGSILWLESIVIPANSPNKATAEVFINFLLEPENAAIFTNEFYYATTITDANAFIEESVLNDPLVFPTSDMLLNAELIIPLAPEVLPLYEERWNAFLAAVGGLPASDE